MCKVRLVLRGVEAVWSSRQRSREGKTRPTIQPSFPELSCRSSIRRAQQPVQQEPSSPALSFLTGSTTHFILAEAATCFLAAPQDVSSPALAWR